MKQKDLVKYTKRGKPRVRASGSGPKPKLPAEKLLSKQIRISLASHARLTALATERAKHITELVDEAVETAFSRPAVGCLQNGLYPEGHEQ